MRARLAAILITLLGGWGIMGSETSQDRELALKAYQDGRYRDAYDIYQQLVLSEDTDPEQVGSDLGRAAECLYELDRASELDGLLDRAAELHAGNWQLLRSAARVLHQAPHYGFVIAGDIERGSHRGGGEAVNLLERDRVRMLRWMSQARRLLPEADVSGREQSAFYQELASYLYLQNEPWRLRGLTDLDHLPEPETGGWYRRGTMVGAPVDEDGDPVTWDGPESWDASRSDGERWRWSLEQARAVDPEHEHEIDWSLAAVAKSWFGVQTLMQGPWTLPRASGGAEEETGTYALSSLEDDETIARLAIGVRRFRLPEGYDHLALYKRLTEKPDQAEMAWFSLAEIYENRRQYPKAADAWRRAIARSGSNGELERRLDQIVGNWGRFEPVQGQAAGDGAELGYRFRNADSVTFTAHRIDVEKLLKDVQEYLRSHRGQTLEWEKLQIENIGMRFIQSAQDRRRYLADEPVAIWTQELDPLPKHFDRSITVATPLQDGGAYWVTAKLKNGNESHVVLWVSDLAIVQKTLDEANLYFIADARTGAPIERAHVELFGYSQRREGRRLTIQTEGFAEYTDDRGQLRLTDRDQSRSLHWLVIARKGGRLAHLGFRGVWYGDYQDSLYQSRKAFGITDRPVYRPGDPVKYKFWIRWPRYDGEAKEAFSAGQTFTVRVHDPQGQVIHQTDHQADRWGGVSGELALTEDAGLGAYSLQVVGIGGTSFRAEEYKKPEFEVTVDASDEPVRLGEELEATVRARYYFGEPVTEAEVKYRILRTARQKGWYPPQPWDWLYGPGYWWTVADAPWYPGWLRWGCRAPIGWWWGWNPDPPEVVAEGVAPIGPDGTLSLKIDTELAKELHGDQDHRYEITAEVVDASRRTIVGRGSIDVSREPFQVVTWLDRGWLRAGDSARAHVAVASHSGEPLPLAGGLELFRISYDESGQPKETSVEDWVIETDETGNATVAITFPTPGQYRLVATITDDRERTVSGGVVFSVIGSRTDGSGFRFDDLEIVLDRPTYAPGYVAKVLINTDRLDSTVLLFLRPTGGTYLPPQLLKLEGRTTEVEVPIVAGDMPNFFVEALTVSSGQLHTMVKSILVPPEKRILEVAVEPESAIHEPGETDRLTLRLTDANGEPVVGSAVISVYDKAVEYISGGSNVPEIRELFWKWLRSHQPASQTNLERWSSWLTPKGQRPWMALGVFGNDLTDDDLIGLAEGSERSARGDAGVGGGELRKLGYTGVAPGAAAAPLEEAASRDGGVDGVGDAQLVEPTVRSDFRDTAFWAASLETDAEGRVEVSVPLPDSLTTWKVAAWAMGDRTRVGSATTEIVTRKDVLVRLQAPRFFVETDEVVLSANVHNYLEVAKDVRVSFELPGDVLSPLGALEETVAIGPRGEARVDLRVRVQKEGEAVVRALARTDQKSDAMEMTFPAYVHGALRTESWAGSVSLEASSEVVALRIPEERRPEQSELIVRFSPTLAGALVDALPYLADYPYGCTEQTLNRFLPAVITQRTLQRLGVDLAAVREARTSLNAQEIGDPLERRAQWQRFERNPVFDEDEVARMVKTGVRKLTGMQLSDGGWGWFSGFGERSYPHTTATVVRGLLVARANDVAMVPGLLEDGLAWLERYQAQQIEMLANAATRERPWKKHADALDALVYAVLVRAGVRSEAMQGYLFRDRTQLPIYALALFGEALEQLGQDERVAAVLAMIDQYVVEDPENETAYLRLSEPWWHWYGSENEAHATYLSLLTRVDPKGRRSAWLAKYLLNNRKHATYWNSTRDTALAIEALADFLMASGESKPNMTVEVLFDGQVVKTVDIDPSNLFTIDNTLILSGDALEAGDHRLELRRQGDGPLYFNVYLTNFTQEDPIPAAGLEVKVERSLYRLVPEEDTTPVPGQRGQYIEQKVERYRREPIEASTELASGDLVEVELEITSKNDYEYLVFEDFKPAGCEPVELQSGYSRNEMGAYVEYRDEGAVFFVRLLARGRHSVSYRLRAEIPGRFSALPTQASAMYAPELRGNSAEAKLTIVDG